MRYAWLFIVCALVVGCGKNRPAPGMWPAYVAGHEGFSDQQWKEVREGIDFLNKGCAEDLIHPDGTASGYPIIFRLVEAEENKKRRAGLAIVEEERCTIEISKVVFSDQHSRVRISVVIHELGHCAGLDHETDAGAVMYRTTANLDSYTPTALDHFFHSVRQNLGLLKTL